MGNLHRRFILISNFRLVFEQRYYKNQRCLSQQSDKCITDDLPVAFRLVVAHIVVSVTYALAINTGIQSLKMGKKKLGE